MSVKFIAHIIESDRAWGSSIDEIKEFPTKEARGDFVEQYNEKYNPEMKNDSNYVPDWYMIAVAVD